MLRRAGTGRHSTVLLCREEATGQEVAVKLLHLTVAEEGARLATHAELLSAGAAANHPCSVLVEDAGFTGEHRPYLIQQFCRGGNAQAKLVNSGPFPVEEVLVIGVRLALALASSHRRGVLHLDVRPANVLFDDAGDALLADHGVARVVQRSAPQIGAIFDPMYSSRELFGWEKPGPAADVYSLGATLYALLNGLPAYAEAGSTSWAALYNEVLRGELPRPNRPDAPEPLLDLIRRMMSVNPEGRPPLSEVHRVLRMLLPPGLAGRVPALEPEPAPEPMLPGWDPADDVTPEEQAEAARLGAEAQAAEKRRNRRKLIAAGTAVVVFAGAATTMTLLLRKDEAKKKTVAGPSASAAPSASASASSGGGSINLPGGVAPSAQEVAPDKLPALMPQAVTEDASGGKVRVSWKAPKNPDTVTTYFVQASAGEKQVGLAQAPKGQTQVVFTNPEAVKPGVCYTVASVIALSNGQIGYAPAKTICRPHG
nr:protein kinase [Streptomyces sp. SID5468]